MGSPIARYGRRSPSGRNYRGRILSGPIYLALRRPPRPAHADKTTKPLRSKPTPHLPLPPPKPPDWVPVRPLRPPECRRDVKLRHNLNQATDVVTEQLGQRLVHHRRIRLAPQRVAELRLDHAERGHDVAPLVVVGEGVVAIGVV